MPVAMARSTAPTRRFRCCLASALLVLVIGACSDGDGGDAGDGPTTTATVRTTTSTTSAGDADADDDIDADEVELAGTAWRLVELVDADGERTSAAGDVPAVISFDASQVEGYDGVDTATGSYELDGDELSIELEDVSELGPPSDPGIEQLLFELLGDVDRAEIDDGELVLHHDGGELRLEPVGGDTAD